MPARGHTGATGRAPGQTGATDRAPVRAIRTHMTAAMIAFDSSASSITAPTLAILDITEVMLETSSTIASARAVSAGSPESS